MSAPSFALTPTKASASIGDGDQSGLDLSGDFSVEFWIRPDNAGGGDQGDIVTKLMGASADEPYAIWKDGTDIVVRVYDGTNATQVRWSSVLTANDGSTWDHIAITCDISNADATKFILYKNGASQGNGSVDVAGGATSLVNSTGNFVIGDAGVRADGLNSELFDVRVWSDIRTGTEVNDNHALLFQDPQSEAGLVGDWFVGGSHGQDRSTNRNDLTVADAQSLTFASAHPTVTGPVGEESGKAYDDGPGGDEVWPVTDFDHSQSGKAYDDGPGQLGEVWPATDMDQSQSGFDEAGGGADPPAPVNDPPVITYVTPGGTLAPNAPITVEVTDPEEGTVGLRRVVLLVTFLETGDPDWVHDGVEFSPRYVALSSREIIPGGFRYIVRRSGGWPQVVGRENKMKWDVFAVDTSGNDSDL